MPRKSYDYPGAYHGVNGATKKTLAGGSAAAALGGVGGVVLAILALAGALPGYLAPIATITIGAAFIAEGAAIASRWSRVVGETRSSLESPQIELGAGMSAEIFGGVAGVVLGILALIGFAPWTLLAIALLVFGGMLILSAASEFDLGTFGFGELDAHLARLTREAALAAAGMQILVAIAAVVLGIVALVSTAPSVVTLIGLLVVSASILFSGAAVGGRVMATMRR